MSRTLLLCFIHGFKGSDNTFHEFPQHLKEAVGKSLPEHRVESIVYPKYETKGELAQAAEAFLEWLKERVMEIRKASSETSWPPNDRDVGVVLVAHSMGGFVAADALFLALNERAAASPDSDFVFPPIQGILTFDTPYNGLARSMFVYGAFSNYSKVSSVFNAMTALSAAAPAGLARLGARNAASNAARTTVSSTRRGPQWTAWQLMAVKTGTVGAIAAGGVVAYMNREAIIRGVKSVRSLNRETVVEGYHSSINALGQGLAYINKGNVGKSFAWLSDHFTFVGALLKQKELVRRLGRMAALKGIGIHDFYGSLGENGYWSGGYFVPERTFCAIPEGDEPASSLFSRCVMAKVEDEVEAHINMFRPDKHEGYEGMKDKAAQLVKGWFLADEPIVDDVNYQNVEPGEVEQDKEVDQALEKSEAEPEANANEASKETPEALGDGSRVPDESPINIAAAASLVPLPDDESELVADANTDNIDSEEKRSYMNHLLLVAQQAGMGVKGCVPSKMAQMPSLPTMPNMPNMPTMPNMPKVPASVSSLSQVSVPSMGVFSRKGAAKANVESSNAETTQERQPQDDSAK